MTSQGHSAALTLLTTQPTVSLKTPGNNLRLEGAWALIVIFGVFAVVVAFVARFVMVQRRMKKAIAELSEREGEYRFLFAHNPCAMWVYDYNSLAILDVNDVAVDMYGYSHDKFLKMTLRDMRGPEEQARLNAILRDVDVKAITLDVARHRTKSGRDMDVEVRGHPLPFPGRTSRMVVITDITDRLRAEERARSTSQMLQSVIDAAPLPIVVSDSEWLVRRWNQSAEALFGWKAEEVVGRQPPYVAPDQLDEFLRMRRIAKDLGGSGRTTEVQCIRKNGSRVHVLVAMAALADVGDQRSGFVSVFTDLTERLLIDEQQRQSQKMEAIGRLAGGIAHDFNNILTVISSYANFLLENTTEEATRTDLGEIALATQRATALTRQLLTFSRRDVVAHRPLNVSEVARGMETMLRRLLNADIAFVSQFTTDDATVIADPSHLEQVIMNLVVNASDAMTSGGTLVMETRVTELDAMYAKTHSDVIPGPYVMLALTDTGKGMDTATMSKVFEPFFTTKEIGRGTGLGLATVYAIVKQLNGHVWVYSEPGQGTTFKVYLPRAVARIESEGQRDSEGAKRNASAGTALLVEDDDSVRRVVRRMLEHLGYTVHEASDGAEGLRVVREFGDSVNLVVTDLMMPVMNGRELANSLAQSNPDLHVLFTSGYTDDAAIRRGLMDSAHMFLQKPFTAEQLARTISELYTR